MTVTAGRRSVPRLFFDVATSRDNGYETPDEPGISSV